MSGSIIPEIPPLGISTLILGSELPAANAGTPAWIKVTPRGATTTRDGRAFSFTPERLVERFKAEGVDIPADLYHAIALQGAAGNAAGAIGWAKELQARADGTFARMEWLASGRAALADKTYRYVSPTVYHDERGDATGLHSISLVPAPALSMPALMSAGAGASKSIREALGLDATADEAACLAAIGTLQSHFVPLGLFSDVVATLNALRGEVRRRQVDTVLEGALKAGKIVPAERAQYLALCSTDIGLAHVATLMERKPVLDIVRPSGLDDRPPPNRAEEETAAELAARATRFREKQTLLGVEMSQVEAVSFASAGR